MMPPQTTANQRRLLLDLLTPTVTDLGFDLEDVTVQLVGRRSLIRVVIDTDSGIALDDIATVSRAISTVLDVSADSISRGPYVLEVSSPGVDRPVSEPRHWRRALGRLVEVPVDGVPLTARIAEVIPSEGVRLSVDGVDRVVPWESLGTGRVQVEFRHSDVSTEDDLSEEAEED
jgi:ribosome maturation factor RimP